MRIKGHGRIPKINGPILLIQLGDIGDVVLSLPAFFALKRHFAGSAAWICVREKAKALLEDVPEINGILSVDATPRPVMKALRYHWKWVRNLRRRNFAMALDLRTGSRGTVIACLSGAPIRIGRLDHGRQGMRKKSFTHLVQPDPELERGQYAAMHHLNILAAVGVSPAEKEPTIRVSLEKRAQAVAILRKEGVPLDRQRVAVSPFSLWRYKEWKVDSWIRLMADLVQKRGLVVVITGSPEERKRAQRLVRRSPKGVFNLAGKTGIGVLPAILHSCRLFIGVDSGSMHVAAAVGTPTVSLFGPSSALTWAPRGKRHLTVSQKRFCVPCREKGCAGSGVSRCLEELTVAEVWRKLDQALSQ